ncbi:UDP-2,3-diacylglucosamine diphosphatase [Flavicella sediminum]|uniref:UDP-2,3-diacylglucosamine diphosphatase n=1 Tax=Flavicella sediminum TaxID=2585141 RepID=UPI001AA0A11C|nr:UDP-2,3-diacylglucosamine diphosphatase [Flavicella sediminum]
MSEKKIAKRSVEVLVLSDIHLGTAGCHAKELLRYLKSIEPQKVVLNGDIIDIWQFKKKYWPKAHMKVIKHLIGWVSKGVEVIYITGNHDEMLRKFEGFQMGTLSIKNKVILELDGKKAWFFHGDVFDVTMQHSKWLAKLGAVGYDFLISLNGTVNSLRNSLGYEKVSFSKKIKNKVKGAVKFINNFEFLVTDLAIDNHYDYVVCGHIHQPEIKQFTKGTESTLYLNSGDWIENLTSLEYNQKKWTLYQYDEDLLMRKKENELEAEDSIDQSSKEVFENLLNDFNLLRK